jgi:UDP:flavonoid glycosyltransferase YjiC (YdhE family)
MDVFRLSAITEVSLAVLIRGSTELIGLTGAGTTAIGLRNGLPTIVVPFFGDQE